MLGGFLNDYIQNVRKYVINKSIAYIEEVDDYDFWNEHIKYVEYYAKDLAEKYNADKEIVHLGALLHDIALVEKIGPRKEHHIQGALRAEKILQDMNYNPVKIARVKQCIINHKSSKNAGNIEDLCVADADILSHFANIPMIFQVQFLLRKKSLCEVKKELRQLLQSDYDDLSEQTKEWFKDEYDNILNVLIKEID